VRLWEQPVEAYLNGGLAALPLATLCQMPADKPLPEALRGVVHEIQQRLTKEASDAEGARLMTAAHILTGLRVRKSDLASIYRGVGLMSESTAYDEAIEEGGILLLQSVLLLQGRKRFGPPDDAYELELNSIHDLDRLKRLTTEVLTAKSWSELLATP
jgi:predicted transposase YdaD